MWPATSSPTGGGGGAPPVCVAAESRPPWGPGGIMRQRPPAAAGEPAPEAVAPELRPASDDWERLSLLLKTVEDLELVDTSLAPESLLWRLFHEDEVRGLPPEPVTFRCDCDTSRIAAVLKNYSSKERHGLADPDGIIRARCEFCGKTHEIGPDSLK